MHMLKLAPCALALGLAFGTAFASGGASGPVVHIKAALV